MHKKSVLAVLTCSVLMAACGGGGGSSPAPTSTTTISGTAATGAAMAGAAITVKDVNGLTRTATSASNGSYSVNVAGLTAPLLIKATLGGASNYSIALPSDINGRINITPLTSLIAANAIGANPDGIFAAYGATQAASITTNSTAATAAAQLLAAALGVNVDPLRANFSADHSGLDAVLDVINVEFNGNTATISDALGNTILTDDFTSVTDIDAADIQAKQTTLDNLAESVAEFPSVLTGLQTWISSMTSQCGNVANYKSSNCSNLYTSTGFLHAGDTTQWDFFDDNGDGQPDEPGISVTFSNLVILERISSTEYRIQFKETGAWGDSAAEALILEGIAKKNASTGNWQFSGDQQLGFLDRHYTFDGTGNVLDFVVKFNNDNKPVGLDHVTVSGPGLPSAGVTISTANFYVDGFDNYRGTLCAPDTARTLASCPNSNNVGLVIPGYDLTQAATPLLLNTQMLYKYTAYDADGAVVSENRSWISVVPGD